MKLNNMIKDENGNGVLICILVLFIMFGIGGLVVDASILYKAKGEMKKAANAAVLSGAQVIYNGDVDNVVHDILKAHSEDDCKKIDITTNTDTVTVNLTKEVSLYFMRIFGVNTATLNVESKAKVGPLSLTYGAVPLGLPDNTPFTVGATFDLNLAPGNGNSGNYNFLNFSAIDPTGAGNFNNKGGGSSDLYYYMFNGYNGDIGLNYAIGTEPGEDTGPAEQAIVDRINSDDPNKKIILIILFDPSRQPSGNSGARYVTGFAYFELTGYVNKDNGKGKGNGVGVITGIFLRIVSNGSTNGDGKGDYKSAYGEKLIE